MWFTSEISTFFLKKGYLLKQSKAHGYTHHRHELKISLWLIQACWELRGDGFGHCHAAECPSRISHLPSSLPCHCNFFASDQPAYRLMCPALFSAQFTDEHTTSPKAGIAVPCLLFSTTYTDIRPTDSNLAGLIWGKKWQQIKLHLPSFCFLLLFHCHHFFSLMLWCFAASVSSKTYLYYLIQWHDVQQAENYELKWSSEYSKNM